MPLLGIDFGTKHIGLAVSDETETIGLPLKVVDNNARLLGELARITAERGIEGVVIGESKNLDWKDNPIMKHIRTLSDQIHVTLNVPVYLEPEFFTTAAARRGNDEDVVDASAAALILQGYLDKKHGKK